MRSDRRALEGLQVEEVKGDILDYDSLLRLFDGIDYAFHVAGHISMVASQGGLVEEINTTGSANVARACIECGVKRLVHFSSVHAFDTEPASEIVDETRPLALGLNHAPYDRSKAAGQKIILNAIEEDGLDAVIVNPGAVIGPHDYKVSHMGEVILDIYHGNIPAILNGGYNWVDVRDVADGAIAAAERGRSGESYLLTGHWVHMKKMSKVIASITGKKTPTICIPLWAAYLASFPVLWGSKVTGSEPKFSPGAVKAIGTHRYISHEKAVAELGYSPRPFEDTVSHTLEWFDAAGMLK